jgi:hypothetical protein
MAMLARGTGMFGLMSVTLSARCFTIGAARLSRTTHPLMSHSLWRP